MFLKINAFYTYLEIWKLFYLTKEGQLSALEFCQPLCKFSRFSALSFWIDLIFGTFNDLEDCSDEPCVIEGSHLIFQMKEISQKFSTFFTNKIMWWKNRFNAIALPELYYVSTCSFDTCQTSLSVSSMETAIANYIFFSSYSLCCNFASE